MTEQVDRNPKALSNIFFQTNRTRKAFEAIEEVIEAGWERKYCKATRLFGLPGTGKTHIVTYFEQMRCGEGGRKVLTLEVAPGLTPRMFGEQFLEGLGDPSPEFGSPAEKLSRAGQAVKAQGYDAIILEEFHRLIDDRTDNVNHAVGHWVTGFLNLRVCPLVLMEEPSAERVLRGNDMLNQRTFPGCFITPYDWGVEQDRQEFRKTMHAIDIELGMPERSGLGTLETAHCIYTFSEGILRRAADLIAKSRRRARQLGLQKLTHDVLAEAADEFLAVGPSGKFNPFRQGALPSLDMLLPVVADVSKSRSRSRLKGSEE